MLPDFPRSKKALEAFYTRVLRQRTATYMGSLSTVPRVIIHEGHRTVLRELWGPREEETPLHEIQGEARLPPGDSTTPTIDDALRLIDQIAAQLARHKTSILVEGATSAAEAAGNVVATNGKITPDAMLEMLEKIFIEFDAAGEPCPLTPVLPVKLRADHERAVQLLENDPVWRQRYQDLILKKREEWRVREARRNLAG